MQQIQIEDIVILQTDDGENLNPRGRVIDTSDLQASIKQTETNLTPIIVRKLPDGMYELIDGHRRLIAMKTMGRKVINAEVTNARHNPLALMLASNVRKNFPPSKLGAAICELSLENKYSIERVALMSGLDVEKARLLVDLSHADPAIQKRVDSGDMSLSAWKALRDKPKDVQKRAAELEKPTVENVRKLTRLEDSQGIRHDLLDALDTQHNLLSEARSLRAQINTHQGSLTEIEKAKLIELIMSMLEAMEVTINEL